MRKFFFGILILSGFCANYHERLENFQKSYKFQKISEEIPEQYAHLKGLEGADLLEALRDLTGKNYKEHGYSEAKSFMYDKVDHRSGKVFTLYSGLWASGKNGSYKESGDANNDGKSGDFVNCEHTWPQSQFAEQLPMRSDLHHLYPTFSVPNGRRGHMPFGFVEGKTNYSNSFGSKGNSVEFEPADDVKGNIARAQMYFYTRYHDRNIFQSVSRSEYWTNKIRMFMDWNRKDPVDDWERSRNDIIEKYQGNRNPFIDFPEFATLIGYEAFAEDRFSASSSELEKVLNSKDEVDDQDEIRFSSYEDLDGLSGEALFDALHKLTGQGFKAHGYNEAKSHMYDEVDHFDGSVRILYSSMLIPGSDGIYKEKNDENGDGTSSDFVNCEHTWPQSFFNKRVPMVSDLHQLYPTLSKPNGMRGSNPFGVVDSPKYSTKNGSKASGEFFEPADEAKGNVARAQLYFYVRYYDKAIFSGGADKDRYWNKNVALFLKWHREDPVDEWEKIRNERIEKYQGNRNPFIDDPGLVERIGESNFLSR